jgi:hypothetical protein
MYSLSVILSVIKSRTVSWTEHVASSAEIINPDTILIRNPKGRYHV